MGIIPAKQLDIDMADIEFEMELKKYHDKGGNNMEIKGYNTQNGYMGWYEGKYQLFACERDYLDMFEED